MTEQLYALPTPGILYEMRFTTYGDAGQARLGLYTNSTPQSLVAQSGVVTFAASASPVTYTVPVPNKTLSAGSYWLVFLTKSDGTGDIWHPLQGGASTERMYENTSPSWGSLPATISNASWGSMAYSLSNVQAEVCP
jgi:hypothetical protein